MTRLDDAVRELYAEAPSDFVTARNARAAAVRREGDREVGAAIAALPKHSASAWILNTLARSGEGDLRGVVELGERYRTAEQSADRAALVSLNSERRSLLAATLRAVRATAEDAGHPLNARAVEEVEQTLRAAIADANAADAVLSGTLIASLSANGIDPVDVSSAIAGSAGGPPRRPSARGGTAAERRLDTERRAEERRAEERRAAERRAAERAAAKAKKVWEQSVARRDALAESLNALEQEVTRVSDELADAEAREKAARAELRDAAP